MLREFSIRIFLLNSLLIYDYLFMEIVLGNRTKKFGKNKKDLIGKNYIAGLKIILIKLM